MSDRIKKIIKVSVFSLLALLFVIVNVLGAIECSDSGGFDRPPKFIEQLSGKVYVFTDPQTGLQYLVYTVNGGICPRYGADGKQLSGGVHNAVS